MWFMPSQNFESHGGATDDNQVSRKIPAYKSCKRVRSKRAGCSGRDLEEGSVLNRVVREEMAFKLKSE